MPRIYERDEAKRQAILVAQDPWPDCALWDLSLNAQGYGQKMVKGKLWRAHRWVWTQANGPIPEGMQINHRCDTPACVNLDHLYLGTQSDNTRDQIERGRWVPPSPRKDKCVNGHLYAETEVIRPNGKRYCRECHRANKLASYHRRKASSLLTFGHEQVRRTDRPGHRPT